MYTYAAMSIFLLLLGCVGPATAASVLLAGGTVIAFESSDESFRVLRNGSVLVTDDRIMAVAAADEALSLPPDTVTVDATNKIISPGFVDTHRHGWQTLFKTIASNTSLVEYFNRYSEFASAGLIDADEVYISQLAGIYEALNGGVTTSIDHAHHTWSDETSKAGLQASIDSGARVFWSYGFHEISNDLINYTISEQLENFREIASSYNLEDTNTELGIAYDYFGTNYFGSNPSSNATDSIVALAQELNVSVITGHTLQGPWGLTNSPEELYSLNILNSSIPIVLAHASFLTARGFELLRACNQYISITPESEEHFGHNHPHSHVAMDQASLGVDTHFAFSADILTQARVWLQKVRQDLYGRVLRDWRVPYNSPMSVVQAFHLATRAGGLALRRPDIGVIAVGAKADILVFDGMSPSMLGWVDPVAAIILHASVGDIESVMVNGQWVKRNGTLTVPDYDSVRTRFLAAAARVQGHWKDIPIVPANEGSFQFDFDYGKTLQVDTLRGSGDGYGQNYV